MPKKNKYGIWIKIVSVVIPVVVAILFGVKIDYQLPIFLPPVYASINALTAVLLVLALIAIKSKKYSPSLTVNENMYCIIITFFSHVYSLPHDLIINNIWRSK